jgi:hypothetical protein
MNATRVFRDLRGRYERLRLHVMATTCRAARASLDPATPRPPFDLLG